MNRPAELPRVLLAAEPTPLQYAERLTSVLGVEVWFKREDLTGLGLGGNKLRMLEYLIGDAVAAQCDSLVTGAGPQSNWAMLAALAARRHGLDPYLVYYGELCRPAGNHALAELVGADIRFTGDASRVSVDAAIVELTSKLRAQGRNPYPLPRGGATALGACGYFRASIELRDQLAAAGVVPRAVWLATGSCGTQAGLLAAARWLGHPYAVVGVTVSRTADECRERVDELANGASRLLGTDATARPGDVAVVEGYLGPGYGTASDAGSRAAALVARTEGIFLDPVFGAKAMAGLLDAVHNGQVAGPVVFLVTGGAPTLFTASGGGRL
ncbi:1-aminocyclopropane-1-carboxylate deaminase/D-cysteine desulfhydrase [Amycolatopsis benzoatilytica]|uniref:1-aminocyclopropane-1-carboxylate deaminase/D-cysteine desulfhydrase n=1 Tax=Amycolatopsis benzoatilytica TaxID=346045 RepID=UPI00036B299E|nr:pyridoxal-phosphate dependent enzyme [Amycolatopsis benzoatilytica]